jgi:hypothetical protein
MALTGQEIDMLAPVLSQARTMAVRSCEAWVAARRCPARSSRPINLCGLTVGVSKCLADLAMLLDQPAPPLVPTEMRGAAGRGLVLADARRAVARPAASLIPRPGPPST